MASDNKPELSLKLHNQFGNGPVKVVCLHGFFGPEVFDKLYGRLSETVYSVYVFSIYGYMCADHDSSDDEAQEEQMSFRDDETAASKSIIRAIIVLAYCYYTPFNYCKQQ